MMGQEPSLSGPISKQVDTSVIPRDGIARIAQPFINDQGTPTDSDDDTMEGYYCGVNPTTQILNPCAETDPPSASDTVRKVVFWKNTLDTNLAETDPWESHFAQGIFVSTNNWDDIPAPTASGERWYNGACNVCHTRAGYHHRDNQSTLDDRAMGMNRTGGCPECHDHDANAGGWIR
jgi:hypothetical protein